MMLRYLSLGSFFQKWSWERSKRSQCVLTQWFESHLASRVSERREKPEGCPAFLIIFISSLPWGSDGLTRRIIPYHKKYHSLFFLVPGVVNIIMPFVLLCLFFLLLARETDRKYTGTIYVYLRRWRWRARGRILRDGRRRSRQSSKGDDEVLWMRFFVLA